MGFPEAFPRISPRMILKKCRCENKYFWSGGHSGGDLGETRFWDAKLIDFGHLLFAPKKYIRIYIYINIYIIIIFRRNPQGILGGILAQHKQIERFKAGGSHP